MDMRKVFPLGLLVLLLALGVLTAAISAIGSYHAAQYLSSVTGNAIEVQYWRGIYVGQIVCAVVGTVGFWLSIRGRKLLLAFGFILIQLPYPAAVGAMQLDVFGPTGETRSEHITVLDGDTLVIDDVVVRVAGIDAPELPPASACWAEAALAGEARREAKNMIHAPRLHPWKIGQRLGTTPEGHLLATVVTDDGADFADSMAVQGHAARTQARWNWCSRPGDLRDPKGPNLWFPPDDRLDSRAAD